MNPKVIMLPEDVLSSINSTTPLQTLVLTHPRTSIPTTFLTLSTSKRIYEINKLTPSKYSSYFVGNTVLPDGGVYTATEVDVILLALPELSEKARKLSPFDQVQSVLGGTSSIGSYLTPTNLSKICVVSDCMGDDMLLYKLDDDKVKEYLKSKWTRATELLKRREERDRVENKATDKQSFQEGFVMKDNVNTAELSSEVKKGKGEGDVDEQIKNVAAVCVAEYLNAHWSGVFLDHVGVSRSVIEEKKAGSGKRKAAWEVKAGRDEESDKILKYTMGESAGTSEGERKKKEEERRRKEGESKKQKDLKKASKGMKSLASFFGGKKK